MFDLTDVIRVLEECRAKEEKGVSYSARDCHIRKDIC